MPWQSFNGAAFLRTRKGRTGSEPMGEDCALLQWGRVLANAEGREISMLYDPATASFNGAAFS